MEMRQTMKIQAKRSEKGQIIFLFAAAFVTIMAFLALMIDFGGAALTYSRAETATDSAAYAAAQGIDMKKFNATDQVQLDPGLASSLALEYGILNSQGKLSIASIYVQGDRVWVVGTMEYHTLFARALGIPVIRARVISSAVTGFGINQSGQ
jgi:Flp pilus assembly protein TadG